MESNSDVKPCLRCGKAAISLQPVDTALRVAIESGGAGKVPPVVCSNCYAELTGSVSQGLKLRIEQEKRDKNKMLLWKNRVNLIKQARAHMNHKAYSEAAISYEKYLRILELVYNKKKGELAPDIFNNSKRSKEMTVIASVYWDLMRIYDTSSQYGNRMGEAADKLAKFLQYSTVYPDILKKAEAFQRTAKHPEVVRTFLRAIKGRVSKCFIASAAFGAPMAPEIQIFRSYRDDYLKLKPFGRKFVLYYYRLSPPVAVWIQDHKWSQRPLRIALRLMAFCIKNQIVNDAEVRDLKDHV